MTRPVRIQLSRKKGFRLQAHSQTLNGLPAVNVARPSRFGNPFTVQNAIEVGYAKNTADAKHLCASAFDEWLHGSERYLQGQFKKRLWINCNVVPFLKGRNLACWCGPDDGCHADVLLRLANHKLEQHQ